MGMKEALKVKPIISLKWGPTFEDPRESLKVKLAPLKMDGPATMQSPSSTLRKTSPGMVSLTLAAWCAAKVVATTSGTV
eukprot:8871612-Pyramimonas_sp.AAC.1